jgi:hypothetical protein
MGKAWRLHFVKSFFQKFAMGEFQGTGELQPGGQMVTWGLKKLWEEKQDSTTMIVSSREAHPGRVVVVVVNAPALVLATELLLSLSPLPFMLLPLFSRPSLSLAPSSLPLPHLVDC